MTPQQSPQIVAGKASGNKVRFAGKLGNSYNNLKALAGKNNHWAVTALREIDALTSGHHKNCVFVKQGQSVGKVTQFTMILPGCKLSVMKRSNGEYLVYEMDPVNDYHKSQLKGDKPGLFRLGQSQSGLDIEFVPNGQIKHQINRIVSITDQHSSVELAAIEAASHASDSHIGGGSYVKRNGLDMHFTPGTKKIGGLSNINQARNAVSDESLHESAQLLAKTMSDASKSVEGVSWISERGGSGVMTQAMGILKTQGVSFEGSKHLAYFSHVTTDIVKAENLAREIGLEFDGKTKSANPLNLNELVGGLGVCGGHIAAVNRFNQDPERTALELSGDLYRETMGSKNAAVTVGVTTMAIGASVGLMTAAAPPTAIATFVAAMGTAAGLGVTLTEAWLPKHFNKVKKLFGA